jgi:hypothetical protein
VYTISVAIYLNYTYKENKMNIDKTEHGGYRREVASKLGLCGNGRMTNEKPIKRAAGGSIPKLATGGALRNLGKAMRHDISHAARKTREGFKDFGRKEKEGFENIGHKIKKDVIDTSRQGFNKHVAQPTRKAAATAKNMAREIGSDINKEVIKPAGRYLKESARKDRMANGGMPGRRAAPGMMYPAVMPPQGMDRRNRMPSNAQPFAQQGMAPAMKKGGKTQCKSIGGHIGDLKIGSGKRVKENVQTRHNFQNVGRMLTGKKEKSVYGAKARHERKEAGLPKMAHGGVGKLRHGVTPKTGIVSSKWKDKDLYM